MVMAGGGGIRCRHLSTKLRRPAHAQAFVALAPQLKWGTRGSVGASYDQFAYDESMPKPKSKAFARVRAEVIRLVGLIPRGKFTTYGSIGVQMNVMARHVAFVMSSLTEQEAAELPWHRVVSADARLSPKMETALSKV